MIVERDYKRNETYLQERVATLLLSKNNSLRLAFLFGFASLSSWLPVFNVWLEDEGLNGSQIGIIAAVPWVVMLIFQPVWGIVADKFGKVSCLWVSLVVAAAAFVLLPAFGSGIVFIFWLTVLVSIFNTPVLPLLDSIALDKVEEGAGISYSNIRFWGAPGYGIGAFVTGWLIPVFGVKCAFFTSSFFLLMVLIVIYSYRFNNSKNKTMEIEFRDLRTVLAKRFLLGFLLVIIIVSIGQSAIFYYLTLYMRQIGASPEITGTAIGVQAMSELPFYFVAAWLLQRTSPGRVVLIAIFATALRLFLYSINTNPNLVIFIETMNGLTWTLLWIASVEFVNEMVPAEWRTTGQSLLWAAYFGAGAISGNIVIGRMYQSMQMQKVYGIICIGILIVAMLASVVFLFTKKIKISRA
jgi:PPP family 3-phenylpropionic acid transporter